MLFQFYSTLEYFSLQTQRRDLFILHALTRNPIQNPNPFQFRSCQWVWDTSLRLELLTKKKQGALDQKRHKIFKLNIHKYTFSNTFPSYILFFELPKQYAPKNKRSKIPSQIFSHYFIPPTVGLFYSKRKNKTLNILARGVNLKRKRKNRQDAGHHHE